MNFKKFINSYYLKDNPLCGISTYKDELNIATGACTRKIYKFILDGTEDWKVLSSDNSKYYLDYLENDYLRASLQVTYMCTHYIPYEQTVSATLVPNLKMSMSSGTAQRLYIADSNFTTTDQFKTYLQQQYAAGTPVCVWYVLATPTTETITVPSGLSGTVEGYLNQSGTPTPPNPIYPTANTVEQWFDLKQYIMGNIGWNDTTVKEWDGSEWQ